MAKKKGGMVEGGKERTRWKNESNCILTEQNAKINRKTENKWDFLVRDHSLRVDVNWYTGCWW